MKKFIAVLLLLVSMTISTGAQAQLLGNKFNYPPSGGGATDAAITFFMNNVDRVCRTNSTIRGACEQVFGYTNPRWHGANVCTANFNTNNNIDDDAAEIQLALNTGLDVYLPDGCKLANKVNFTADGQSLYMDGHGGRYNSNFPGNKYIFMPNDLWTNRATSLNCAVDSMGYDNVTIRNIAFRSNFYKVGSVGHCNSVGIRAGRGAAFSNLINVSFLNMGNGVGAAMESFFDFRGSSTDSHTLGTGAFSFTTDTQRLWTPGDVIVAQANGISPTTTMTGTVTSYNQGTGALVMNSTTTAGTAGTYASWTLATETKCRPISTEIPGYGAAINELNNNVFQARITGIDVIGNCMGIYGNMSDLHVYDLYCANQAHNCVSSLPGFGSGFEIANARIEYSGFGAGATGSKNFVQGGAGVFLDGTFNYAITNLSCDHQYGACIKGGPNAKNILLNNIIAGGSFYTAQAGNDNAHFVFEGVDGLIANGISTFRNGVDTPYVVRFTGTNNNVVWNGLGGAQGAGAATGQWNTAYFDLVTTPVPFDFNVPGVGAQISGLTGYTETSFNIGNSGTAFTLSLAFPNGTFQRVTATGNATVTMPAQAAGKSFTLRYYTGAGGFTASFTGVKWPGGTAPTLTATANRMDVFTFISDGTSWYGSVTQNYTP